MNHGEGSSEYRGDASLGREWHTRERVPSASCMPSSPGVSLGSAVRGRPAVYVLYNFSTSSSAPSQRVRGSRKDAGRAGRRVCFAAGK
ncbi:hypothetical protein VTH06DRAFT_2081 [Thermothelomyces fergusii]